jgi:ubiquinone biosynthesis protein
VDELEAAVRTVCEPIFSKPLKDISFGHVLLQLLSIAQRFDMVVQTQLILLQKTLVQVEGLGRVLYPELDIWQTGKPVLKAWMRDQTGPRATLRRLRRDWPDLRHALEKLPQVARKLVDETLEGEATAQKNGADREMQRAAARSRYLVSVGGILLIAAALWLGLATEPRWPGWVTAGAGFASLWFGRPKL